MGYGKWECKGPLRFPHALLSSPSPLIIMVSDDIDREGMRLQGADCSVIIITPQPGFWRSRRIIQSTRVLGQRDGPRRQFNSSWIGLKTSSSAYTFHFSYP